MAAMGGAAPAGAGGHTRGSIIEQINEELRLPFPSLPAIAMTCIESNCLAITSESEPISRVENHMNYVILAIGHVLVWPSWEQGECC